MLKNPFVRKKGEQKKKPPKPKWYELKPAEYMRLLDAAPLLRWKAAWALAYTTGLRFGELFNLRWSDIDFQKRSVEVQNHTATAETPPFTTKNGESRTIGLSQHTLDILCRLQHQVAVQRIPYVLLTRRQHDNVVQRWNQFKERSKPWENRYMVNNTLANFKRHVKAAGIEPDKKLCVHTFRKCCGKNWADQMPNPEDV
jgi:integrase